MQHLSTIVHYLPIYIQSQIDPESIPKVKQEAEEAIKACLDRGDKETADELQYKLNLLQEHTDGLKEKADVKSTYI